MHPASTLAWLECKQSRSDKFTRESHLERGVVEEDVRRGLGRLVAVGGQRVEEGRPRQLHDVLEVALARRRPLEAARANRLPRRRRPRRPRDGPGQLGELAQVVHHGAAALQRLLR